MHGPAAGSHPVDEVFVDDGCRPTHSYIIGAVVTLPRSAIGPHRVNWLHAPLASRSAKMPCATEAMIRSRRPIVAACRKCLVVCPRTVYTDLSSLRLLSEWHEVKLQYTAVLMLCMPLSMVGVAASKVGPACDGVGFDPCRSSCQKAARGMNPSNDR